VIRPFRFGDIFLVQRLGRQATKLNIVQALLHRQSAFWASLTTINPWNGAKVTTYILRQHGHGLVGDGFLQVQKRPGRPETDIARLAPGLDTPTGHPAIWEKLLSQYAQEAARLHIERIYADVPDQPLPVNTLTHVGYRTYLRQTIWRLSAQGVEDYTRGDNVEIRPQVKADEWALKQLYRRIVPEAVQLAEGMASGDALRPPILDWWHGGAYSNYLLVERGEVRGSIQVAQGRNSYWLQLWADYIDTDPSVIHQLLRFALGAIKRRSFRQPVYTTVCDYQGGLGAILMDYGFAPVTDRAKMVKHVAQWVRVPVSAAVPALENVPNVVAAPFRLAESQAGDTPSLPPNSAAAVIQPLRAPETAVPGQACLRAQGGSLSMPEHLLV